MIALGIEILLLILAGMCVAILSRTLALAPEVGFLASARRDAIARRVPFVELAVWALFLAMLLVYLTRRSNYPSSAVIALVLALGAVAGWGMVRDYIAGIVLRSEGGWRVGDQVGVGGFDGQVVALGWRSVSIVDVEGDLIRVPYHLVSSMPRVRRRTRREVARHAFTVPALDGVGLAELLQCVERAVLLNHWASAGRGPLLRRTDDGAIEVTVYAIASARVPELEAVVRAAASAKEASSAEAARPRASIGEAGPRTP